jgi:hypothetical protein
MGTEDSVGERHVAEYLAAKGWPFEREPDVEGRNPDFVVDTPDGRVAVEVFEPSFEVPEGGGSFDSIAPLEALFKSRKSKQSQAARAAGLPIVMVVGSEAAPFAYNLWSVMGVMFGREGVAIPLDGPVEDARSVRLGGAKVQPARGTSVSAIALLQRFCPTEVIARQAVRDAGIEERTDYPTIEDAARAALHEQAVIDVVAEAGQHDPAVWQPRLVICHNPFASIPLSRNFAGPYDEQYGSIMVSSSQGEWRHLASGHRCHEVFTTV